MFILFSTEQDSHTEYSNAYAAALGLLTEVQRQWQNDVQDDEDAAAEWRDHVKRARRLVTAAEDGARQIEEPITFMLPNGHSLVLNEAGETGK